MFSLQSPTLALNPVNGSVKTHILGPKLSILAVKH